MCYFKNKTGNVQAAAYDQMSLNLFIYSLGEVCDLPGGHCDQLPKHVTENWEAFPPPPPQPQGVDPVSRVLLFVQSDVDLLPRSWWSQRQSEADKLAAIQGTLRMDKKEMARATLDRLCNDVGIWLNDNNPIKRMIKFGEGKGGGGCLSKVV